MINSEIALPDNFAAIVRLADEMRLLPQIELPTDHYFNVDGMYGRVCHFNTGDIAVGKVQKKPHFFIVIKGCFMVGKQRCEAGTVIVGEAGKNRAVIALEDSICMTVHRSKKLILDEIERQLIKPDRKALFDSSNKLKSKELT